MSSVKNKNTYSPCETCKMMCCNNCVVTQLKEKVKESTFEANNQYPEYVEEFLNSDRCKMCGSQRCERTDEWLEKCGAWKEFLNKKFWE
jgi:hypothetical protein